MQRFIIIIGLEVYAAALAWLQYRGGVATDEAKYLLNIPYPHPPVARWIFNQFEFLPFQEFFWRFILASLLVQAVWLIIKIVPHARLAVSGLWLLSASLILQTGTIMMAPLTVLQGIMWIYMYRVTRRDPGSGIRQSGLVGCFWLLCVFTAYQIVLYIPFILMVFWRLQEPLWKRLLLFGLPGVLVVLYIATNPLAAASFVNAGTQNADQSLLLSLKNLGWMWLVSGGVLSLLGTLGILYKRNYIAGLSFLLVCLFIITSSRAYYPLFFLPILIAGLSDLDALKRSWLILFSQAVVSVLILTQFSFHLDGSVAERVMHSVQPSLRGGIVLINGSFGHEWQYESSVPVYRYVSDLLPEANAVVCLEECPRLPGFTPLEESEVSVWVQE